jgi:hypothetical protein
VIALARSPSRATTFRASLTDGLWSVTKNNVFYGDYFSRAQAIRSACNGARTVEASGGQARVLVLPNDELIAHRETP